MLANVQVKPRQRFNIYSKEVEKFHLRSGVTSMTYLAGSVVTEQIFCQEVDTREEDSLSHGQLEG